MYLGTKVDLQYFFSTKQVLSFSCHSSIGRDTGPQNLVLGSSCYYIGVILHELNHAVGFFHEQSRYDRDDYILVNWENIQNGIIFQDLYSITLFLIPRFLLSIESLTKKSFFFFNTIKSFVFIMKIIL